MQKSAHGYCGLKVWGGCVMDQEPCHSNLNKVGWSCGVFEPLAAMMDDDPSPLQYVGNIVCHHQILDTLQHIVVIVG